MNIETKIEEAFDAVRYISSNGLDRNIDSRNNIERLSLMKKCRDLEDEGRTLFHLSVTYKRYQSRDYSESDINTFFKNFYQRTFLPRLLNTRNIHTNIKKSIQPICFSFVDEHEHSAKQKTVMNVVTNRLETIFHYPTRLHHHAIVAAHPATLEKMNSLCGISTIPKNKWSERVLTTELNKCDSNRILYSSKMYSRYPDFQMYPNFKVERLAA